MISHYHRFVFVHVWKSGGISVTAALNSLRRRNLFDHAGHLKNRLAPYCKQLGFQLDSNHRHHYALDIVEQLGPNRFDNYFKFAFVRNSWDWLVSLYFFFTKSEMNPYTGQPWRNMFYNQTKDMSFDEFVDWVANDGLTESASRKRSAFRDKRPVSQKDWLSGLDGTILVDFVGRYENLQQGFDHVCQKIELESVGLPRLNQTNHAEYRTYYSPETQEKVRAYFSGDIEEFGFEF